MVVDGHTVLDMAAADRLLACTVELVVQMLHSAVALVAQTLGAEPWGTAVLYTADLPPLLVDLSDRLVIQCRGH